MSPASRSFRERIREVMEPYEGGPDSTVLSLVVDLVVLTAILVSCALVVLEWTHPESLAASAEVELIFTFVFVVEYGLRWYSAENRWIYPFTALALLDLLAILPGLLMLGSEMLMLRVVRGMRLLRLLRLLRLIRLLRLLRYGPLIHRSLVQARVWFSSLIYQYRLGSLGRLFLWAVVALFVGANVLHFTETAMDDQTGPFEGYWRSYWSILVVLVSGIEDKEPLSLLGRFQVALLLVVGVVLVGMLTGEIVSVLVRRGQRAGKVALKPPTSRFTGHILILGLNQHADNVIKQLHAALHGRHHILVVAEGASQMDVTDPVIYRKVYALDGNPRDTRTLDRANLERAARVIVLAERSEAGGDGDSQTLMATLAVVSRRRDVPITVELVGEDSLRYTHVLGDLDLVLGRRFAERMAAQAVLNPGITTTFNDLMSFTDDSNEIYAIEPPAELVGGTFREARLFFLERDDLEIVPIGIDRSASGRLGSDVDLAPVTAAHLADEDRQRIAAGDRLIVLAYHRPELGSASDPWSTTSLVRI